MIIEITDDLSNSNSRSETRAAFLLNKSAGNIVIHNKMLNNYR
jgi:hypothetical protein